MLNNDLKIVQILDKSEMDTSFPLINEVYTDITIESYQTMIAEMTDNYFQIQVKNGDEIVGVSGCWIGTKIWCGKYLEMDNVVVSSKFRSKGIGKMMSDFLAEVAEKENCKIMCLDAYTDNFGAGKFYMNQGFIPRGFHYIKMM